MKKRLTIAGLMLAMTFTACVEIPVENPNATRAVADTEGKNYYWSGGEKIWLDVDQTKMIIGFDNEQELSKTFPSMISQGRSYTGIATALIDVGDENVRQKISVEKSVKNKIFAYKYSGYDTPFYMT